MKSIQRASTVAVSVGNVTIGGNNPIVVQSMTNTETADVEATTNQIKSLVTAGSELVRIAVNSAEAAQAVPEIYAKLKSDKCHVPLIGDFHFNGHKLLQNYPDCAKTLSKYRINPGNVGRGSKHNEQFSQMIECALRYNKPISIGVNWGSLDPDLLAQLLDENALLPIPRSLDDIKRYALVESVLRSADFAKKQGLDENKIILSCKVSSVPDLIKIYEELSVRTKLPLHLGLTEAGMGDKGIVSSVAGLAILIQKGVADTIRVSLTPEPDGDSAREVRIAQEILQSVGVRSFTPQVVSCPGCGRTSSDYFQRLAKDIEHYIQNNMPVWKKEYQGVEKMTVAVMGCVVNGPGESKNADIGISLPGRGERPVAPVYENGQKTVTLKGTNISKQFIKILEKYVTNQYKKKEVIN